VFVHSAGGLWENVAFDCACICLQIMHLVFLYFVEFFVVHCCFLFVDIWLSGNLSRCMIVVVWNLHWQTYDGFGSFTCALRDRPG
jgi:hypothetical protein